MTVYTSRDSKCVDDSKSIFLAGPSIRNNKKWYTPWRSKAIDYFYEKGFKGNLFIPEPFNGDYLEQIAWEEYHLEKANYILFWIPRDMDTLPGLTTNIEFGEWMKSSKVVLGFPENAQHMRYIKYKALKYNVPISYSLEETVSIAIERLNDQN